MVGTYRTLGMGGGERKVLALPGTFTDGPAAADRPAAVDLSNASFLLVRKGSVDWAEVTRLNAAGLEVTSRSVITDPPPDSALDQ